MLKYKYKKIQPIDGLTLHTEKLTLPSQIKDFFLRVLTANSLFVNGVRGPARVQSRLISNLKNGVREVTQKTDWILNVNGKENWETIEIQSKNLILGPNIEFGKMCVKEKIENHANSVILVPSSWVIPVLQSRLKWFKGKYRVWQSDLDIEYWKPSTRKNRKFILIYRKYDTFDEDYRKIVYICDSLGLNYKVITYGHYNQRTFRRLLRISYLAIWLGTTESQGIALLESWSTNVPTFVREKNIYVDDVSGQEFVASAAPYLTDDCGYFFEAGSIDIEKIKQFQVVSRNLTPRAYVVENYSKLIIDNDMNDLFRELHA